MTRHACVTRTTTAADGRSCGIGPGTPVPQFRGHLIELQADPGAQLDLLLLQLGHQAWAGRGPAGVGVGRRIGLLGPVVLSDRLPLTAAGGHLQGLRGQRHRHPRRIDDQQFFLDSDGAHRPMITGIPVVVPAGPCPGRWRC